MPPKKKNAEGKKTQQKKKEKMLEDKTFGLKNKNKSKKVQQQIQSIEKSVLNSGDPKQRKMDEQRKLARVAAKARKKAQEEEQNALFGEALLAVQKKGSMNKKDGKVEAKGRDHDDDGNKTGTSRAMKMYVLSVSVNGVFGTSCLPFYVVLYHRMYQMDAQEMEQRLREDPNYVPTLEDQIEAERQAKVAELKKSGKPGTPVTEETFRAWQERKRKARADAAKKLVEVELKKKKGGKGLAVLSGRDLYEYKKELFADDDADLENAEGSEDGDVNGDANGDINGDVDVGQVAAQVQSDLFLEGDDDDLDDLIDED